MSAWASTTLSTCPLVPAVEPHLKAVPECPGDGLHPGARQERAVNRDGLPVGELLARYEVMAGLISIQGYSAWIQLTKSSRLTVSSRVG
jgi:hypothetical protein